jgi:hypothetical protein
MKKAWIATALICSSITYVSAQSEEWRLAGFIDGNPDRTFHVIIDQKGPTTTIRSFDGGSAVSTSSLDENGNPFLFRKFALDNSPIFEATVADGRRIAARSGGRERTVKSPNAIVLTDPSSFWVFSLWLSRNPAFMEESFSLYQEDENRLVGMRLRNTGVEMITVGKKTLRAHRLEMALSDPIARLFWPHVYRYWYSADDFRFLAYEGMLADKRLSRTENN